VDCWSGENALKSSKTSGNGVCLAPEPALRHTIPNRGTLKKFNDRPFL